MTELLNESDLLNEADRMSAMLLGKLSLHPDYVVWLTGWMLLNEAQMSEGRPLSDVKLVHGPGAMLNMVFDAERTRLALPQLKTWVNEFPAKFFNKSEEEPEGGGGWSFLQLCDTKDGDLWTGMHKTMDSLLAMWLAAGYAQYLMPREMWNLLPGSMPYVLLKREPDAMKPMTFNELRKSLGMPVEANDEQRRLLEEMKEESSKQIGMTDEQLDRRRECEAMYSTDDSYERARIQAANSVDQELRDIEAGESNPDIFSRPDEDYLDQVARVHGSH